jgi:hypothetical protein
MSVRVVMPRQVPRAGSQRVMWRMWNFWGYSCRPAPGGDAKPGWVVLEFWIEAPSACVDVLPSYEWELDEALLSGKIRAEYEGRGARIEGRR